jgi:hypothetical protein
MVKFLILTLCSIVFIGCTSIPPEASKLSHQVSKDFEVIQKNYISLVHALFMQKKQRIDELFVTYSLELRAETFEEPEIQQILCAYTWDLVLVSDFIEIKGVENKTDVDRITKHVTNICQKTKDFGYSAPDPSKLDVFGPDEALNQFQNFMNELDAQHASIVDEERTTAINTLESERDLLIEQISVSFTTLNSAQSTLTAWVDSVVDAETQKREVLELAGLEDLQSKIDSFGEGAYQKLIDSNDSFSKIKDYKEKICKLIPKKQDICEKDEK